MHRNPLVLAALAACLMSATVQAAEPTLFSEHLIPAASMRQANAFISDLASARSTRQLQVVKARAAQVDIGTERLYLNLVPGKPLVVDQLNAYRNEDGTVVWNGMVGGIDAATARLQRHGPRESIDDPLNSATIVRNGNMLTGSVRVDGRLYQIEPIGQGRHAVIEVDEAALPPDDGGQPIPMGKIKKVEASESPAGTSGPTVVRVMVVYTKRAKTRDPTGWAQTLIAEANRGYAGSRVNVRLELAGVHVSKYREYLVPIDGTAGEASYRTDLARFRGRNDGFLDRVHALRDQQKADIMMLVRRKSDVYCGLASEILADADTAFAAMSRNCGPGRFTFHHEIGHLQGALHDPASDSSTEPFAFGHGFISRRGNFSTVMSIYAPWNAPRVTRLSNPDVELNGVPMGTAERHDNARVLNLTRERIAGFR